MNKFLENLKRIEGKVEPDVYEALSKMESVEDARNYLMYIIPDDQYTAELDWLYSTTIDWGLPEYDLEEE